MNAKQLRQANANRITTVDTAIGRFLPHAPKGKEFQLGRAYYRVADDGSYRRIDRVAKKVKK